ncbi:hypothetical protein ACQUEF_01785 [Vagococcus fluvialis]|uniref:hypothetical protein n=1 Tax=Vagococcus fluvialis TaxID=2738 RepID=UPI003D100ADE
MAKTDKTKFIERRLWAEKNIRGDFGCFEVTVGWYGKEIVDFITYKTNGEFRCYEIKVSVQDFYSNARLSFLGDFNYYVIPIELLEKLRKHKEKEIRSGKWFSDRGQDLSKKFDETIKNQGIGLIVVHENGRVEPVINAKRKHPDLSVKMTLLQSMVRSLNLEVTKAYKNKGYWE